MFLTILIVVLFALAIFDLIVGVSNDAVNFTNSAIGSRVASRNAIMAMAAVGIFTGVFYSVGMMDIAKKGIFLPEYFTFYDVLTIFVAVMFTDVILLDLFNTYGLPTSTSVSLVFELFGASVAVAAINVLAAGSDLSSISKFINTDRILLMISGIFISVFLAFVFGALIQFLTRLIFTFHRIRNLAMSSVLWSSLAITMIVYFILVKGLKGSALAHLVTDSPVFAGTLNLILAIFAVVIIVLTIINKVLKINPFKVVILIGTFALALAFAANDLVNFIGVPMAGWTALKLTGGHPDPSVVNMSGMHEPTEVPLLFLAFAGLVMVITLWLSKKARKVTRTEINLAHQTKHLHKFKPSKIARSIVDISTGSFSVFNFLLGRTVRKKIKKRFKTGHFYQNKHNDEEVAFDFVRASVNLMVASALISFGTSLKLPLSTTYVTFMVAMGTSLADGAWNLETAAHRVNGILTVIGGWFVTAFLAFIAAFLMAIMIFFGKTVFIVILIVLTVIFILKTNKIFKAQE